METLLKKLEDLREHFLRAKTFSDINRKIVEEQELRGYMANPAIWNNREKAVKIGQRIEELATETKEWLVLEQEIREAEELGALALKEGGGDLTAELQKKYDELVERFEHLEFSSLFSGHYDRDSVLLTIRSGIGGVDAQDWAQILERMYLRFSERQAWKTEILDKNYGNEAGVKNVMMRISGLWAYGYLKSENGLHRLLRNSPFNSDGLRHTSYASVEVIPEIKDNNTIIIKDEDLRIDVYRSSGPGGQGVNTTDSAVRVVYLPTGLTVTCQNERSQHQNKETALKVLKIKLYKLALEKKEAEERRLKGKVSKTEWGNQIRSYFLYGRRLIKDHRTNYETSNVDNVLDGALEPFMEAYLRWLKK